PIELVVVWVLLKDAADVDVEFVFDLFGQIDERFALGGRVGLVHGAWWFFWSISASNAAAISSGRGGQPLMRSATGSTSSTAPTRASWVPSRLQPRAQSPRAATRRGSGM